MKNESYIMYIKNDKIYKYVLEGRLKKIKKGFANYYLKELNKKCKDFMSLKMENDACLTCEVDPNISYIEFNNISFEISQKPNSMTKFIDNKNLSISFRNCSLNYLYLDDIKDIDLTNCSFYHIITQKLENVKIVNNQKFEPSKIKELPLFDLKSSLKKDEKKSSNITINAQNFYLDASLLDVKKINIDSGTIHLGNLKKAKELILDSEKIKICNTNIHPDFTQIKSSQMDLKNTIINSNFFTINPTLITMDEKSKITSDKYKIHDSFLASTEKIEFSLKNNISYKEKRKEYRRKMISILKGIESYYRNSILEEKKSTQEIYNKLIKNKKEEIQKLKKEYNDKEELVKQKLKKISIKDL